MIDKIVELIIEQARHTQGQDAAARIHAVLMEVRQEVARVISAEQKKEREKTRASRPEC